MNNKKNKKVLLIAIIFIFIIILTLLIALTYLKAKNDDNTSMLNKDEFEISKVKTNSDFEKNKREYVLIADYCTKEYFRLINKKSRSTYKETGRNAEELIYDLLSENYIKDNSITVENIESKIEVLDEYAIFSMRDMQLITEKDSECSAYYIEGVLQDQHTYNIIAEKKFVLYLNKNDMHFAIEPVNTKPTKIKKIKISEGENIYHSYKNITDESIITDYLASIKASLLGDSRYLYSIMVPDYRERKYSTYEKLQEYIQENKDDIFSARLEEYKVNKYENYTQYVAVDQYENYYIIIEFEPLKYFICLDNYIIVDSANQNALDVADIHGTIQETKVDENKQINNKLQAVTNISQYFSALQIYQNYIVSSGSRRCSKSNEYIIKRLCKCIQHNRR